MKYFIEVTGPYDAVHVGPFETNEAALHWLERNRFGRSDVVPFDFHVMTDAEREHSVHLYGAIPIQNPEETEL